MDIQEFQGLALEQLRELKQEIRDTRTELKNDIVRLDQKIDSTRAELKSDIADLRSEMGNLRTELKGDISDLRSDMKEDRQKLEEVYQARNSVKIKFAWQWSMVSFIIAIFAAGMTQVFD